jgi:hypothetical protein
MAHRSYSVGRAVLITYSGSNPNAAAVTIKKSGTNTTDSVGVGEQLIITAFEFVSEAGGVSLVSGGTGAVILSGKIPPSGGGIAQTRIERRCVKATPPTVTATAGGQVDFTAEGIISSSPTT